jgi:hypothetical protein
MTRSRLQIAVRCTLGALLLAAAGLKAAGGPADTVASLGLFASTPISILVIEFEFLLGLWLLWGRESITAWLFAFVTFLTFAAVNVYWGSVGQASCGCFGKLSVSPWYACGIDVAALIALVVARPDLKPFWDNPHRFTRRLILLSLGAITGLGLLLALLTGVSNIAFGSLDEALAVLSGDRIVIRPALLDMGEAYSGEELEGTLEVVNRSDRPLRVVGGTSDCNCIATLDLPLTIASGESGQIKVRMKLPGGKGNFTRRAMFFIDDQWIHRVSFRLGGRSLGSAPKTETAQVD